MTPEEHDVVVADQRRVNAEAIRKSALENPYRPPPSSKSPSYSNGNGHAAEYSVPVVELRWFAESTLRTTPATIARLLGDTALALVYGASGSGKSTLILDAELAIAREIAWRGLKTKGGLVVHICGEGAHGVQQRLIAYAQRHMDGKLEEIPFAVVPSAISLMDPYAIGALIDTLRGLGKEHGGVRLITFDTLARCLPPGDENDSGDMGVAIAACDRIRKALNCAVVLIHHSGKDAAKGARGHSSLRAAVDTEILVEEVMGVRWATVCKQRDLPTAGPFGFDLEAVEIGRDDDDQAITACVVVHRLEMKPAKDQPKGKHQNALLAALREWRRAHADRPMISTIELTAVAKEQGLPRQRRQEAVEALERYGWLQPTVGGHKFVEE